MIMVAGFIFLCIWIFVILLIEFGTYRFVYPEQKFSITALTVFYANLISVVLVMLMDSPLRSFSSKISIRFWNTIGGFLDFTIYFFCLFLLSWLIEAVAIYILRKKLRVEALPRHS